MSNLEDFFNTGAGGSANNLKLVKSPDYNYAGNKTTSTAGVLDDRSRRFCFEKDNPVRQVALMVKGSSATTGFLFQVADRPDASPLYLPTIIDYGAGDAYSRGMWAKEGVNGIECIYTAHNIGFPNSVIRRVYKTDLVFPFGITLAFELDVGRTKFSNTAFSIRPTDEDNPDTSSWRVYYVNSSNRKLHRIEVDAGTLGSTRTTLDAPAEVQGRLMANPNREVRCGAFSYIPVEENFTIAYLGINSKDGPNSQGYFMVYSGPHEYLVALGVNGEMSLADLDINTLSDRDSHYMMDWGDNSIILAADSSTTSTTVPVAHTFMNMLDKNVFLTNLTALLTRHGLRLEAFQ